MTDTLSIAKQLIKNNPSPYDLQLAISLALADQWAEGVNHMKAQMERQLRIKQMEMD